MGMPMQHIDRIIRSKNVFIALGAAGLDDAGHAVRGKHVDVVAEREERVACAGKAALLHALALAEVLGALAGKQCGVNAVALTRAQAR